MNTETTSNQDEEQAKEEFKRAFVEAARKLKEEEEKAEKPFWDHLEELRQRVMRCLYVICFFGFGCYFVREPILEFLKQPLFDVLPEGQQHLVFTGVFESFLNSLQVSAIAGFCLSLPFVLHQLWAFIAPGLLPKERKLAGPFIFSGTLFFILGLAFAYYFVFPQGFRFMIEFNPQDVPMITVSEYFGMIFRLFLVFGLAFEFPVILMFLARLGVIDAKMLQENRRAAIIAIAVVCAVAAPPDALSMILMMIPLYFFYEGVIFLIGFQERKKKASR